MNRQALTWAMLIALLLVVIAQPWQAAAEPSAKEATLLDRVAMLEKQVAKLQKELRPIAKQYRVDQIRFESQQAARRRMSEDREHYTKAQLGEIEQPYRAGSKNWGTPQAKAALEKLIEKFSKANRAGCAVLYLAQMSEGDEAESYYKQAIEQYGDCYYGDGVQVGPYAMFKLAFYYRKHQLPDKADAMFKQLVEEYPDAINHRGGLLSDLMPVKFETHSDNHS